MLVRRLKFSYWCFQDCVEYQNQSFTTYAPCLLPELHTLEEVRSGAPGTCANNKFCCLEWLFFRYLFQTASCSSSLMCYHFWLYTCFSMYIFFSIYCVLTKCNSPWYNHAGWLGIKYKVTYYHFWEKKIFDVKRKNFLSFSRSGSLCSNIDSLVLSHNHNRVGYNEESFSVFSCYLI